MSRSVELEKDLTRVSDILDRNSKLFRRMANVTNEEEEMRMVFSTISTQSFSQCIIQSIS
jgi:hypothetical protein